MNWVHPTECRSERSVLWTEQRESDAAREQRIFGGPAEQGKEGDEGGVDLRGPMLDVVLGLFSGMDYDDAALS